MGEGSTDVGETDIYGRWEQGCIIDLLQKFNPVIELDFIAPPPKKDLKKIKTVPKKGAVRIEGHGVNIQKLLFYANLNNLQYDFVVYYGDTDRESGTTNSETSAKRQSAEAYKQAQTAFDIFNVQGIPIIPLRMLESWLLADQNSFLQAFGAQVSLPRKPELLWGKKSDPTSSYPKHELDRVLVQCGESSNRNSFREIMKNSSIKVMSLKCPISFPPFQAAAEACLRA